MLVDSHAHLDSEPFASDLDEVLQRAADAGVGRILTIGCVTEQGFLPSTAARATNRAPTSGGCLQSVAPVIRLAEDHPHVFAALGVHPHDARCFTDQLGEEILRLMDHPKVVGWGEIGLDFHYDHSPRDQQRQAFRRQLRLARAAGKPVIIHCREAEQEVCRMLAEVYGELLGQVPEHGRSAKLPLGEECSQGPGGVLHCFSQSLETAQCCISLGFYVSFGGILTFPRAESLRETARQLPAHRLLLETDSPYLAPVPFRGRRNEPAFLPKVAEKLAEIRATPLEDIHSLTTTNFHRLFGAK